VIRAVTFDMTGTLAHAPRMPEIYSETLARHGVHLSPEKVGELFPVVWSELDLQTVMLFPQFQLATQA